MKHFLLIIVFFISSCTHRSNKNDIVKKIMSDFYINKNYIKVDSVYNLVKNQQLEINSDNFSTILSLYFSLKKYDELDSILASKGYLIKDNFLRNQTVNLIRYYKNKNINFDLSKSYIYININALKQKIYSNPYDSTLIIEYLQMKSKIVGIKKLKKEIDSLKRMKLFSGKYYDNLINDIDIEDEFKHNKKYVTW